MTEEKAPDPMSVFTDGIDAKRWGLGAEPEEPDAPPEPSVSSLDRRPHHPQLRGYAPHEKLSDKKRLRLVKRLSAEAPNGFSCKETCGKCCEQPLDVLWGEWEQLNERADVKAILLEHTANADEVHVVPRTPWMAKVGLPSGRCPFLHPTTKQCRIHDVRPFSCRVYGQHWFARCSEGVESSPTLDVSDKAMQSYGLLSGLPFGTMPLDRWPNTREIVEQWRTVEPEKVAERRDQMPALNDVMLVADKLVAATPVDSAARKRLEEELSFLRTEAEARQPKPETTGTADVSPT